MAWNRPTLKTIISRIKGDINTELAANGTPLRRTLIGVLAVAYAGAVHGLYGFIEYFAKQLSPLTATGVFLRAWATFFGLTANAASYAIRTLDITGTGTPTIDAGTVYTDEDGNEFTTDESLTLIAGAGSVTITASEAGTAGNLGAGASLTLVTAIAGVDSEATISADDTDNVDAVDAETDEELRIRLLERLANPPQGGANHDYVAWAKEISGVTRVWVTSNYGDLNKVGVTFVRDNDVDIIPSAGEITQVQEYLDTKKPNIAVVVVYALTANPINAAIESLVIDDDAILADVKDAIDAEGKDMLRRLAGPGVTIQRSNIIEAISLAPGEKSHSLTTPAGNHTSSATQIATWGTPTYP